MNFNRLLTAKDAVEAIQLTWPGEFMKVEAQEVLNGLKVRIHRQSEPLFEFEIVGRWELLRVREWLDFVRHRLESQFGLPPAWLKEAMRLYV